MYPPKHWPLSKWANGVIFDAVAWSDSTVEEAIEIMDSLGDVTPIMRRIDMLGVSAHWTVLSYIRRACGSDTHSKAFKSMPPPLPPFWLTLIREHKLEDRATIFQPLFLELLLDHIQGDHDIPLTKVALYEPCMVDEIITTLKAEFLIQAPENRRLANIRRPATIINVQDFSGLSVVQETLQHVAAKVEADILHLGAHDIAHIVGRYIGQDITRSLGDISLLGYKTAENCGRLKPRPVAEEETEETGSLELPFTVMLPEDKARRDPKRQSISMDEFLLNSGTRGKSDELWEDMKVNAALDELIHSADTDEAKQRPLIVHIHDFNALNMDEIGAAVVAKIRKVVDELWLSGPFKGLELSERIIHLSQRYFPHDQLRSSCKSTVAMWEKQDYLRENDENIVRMLWSMTEAGNAGPTNAKGKLGLDKYARNDSELARSEHFSKYWDSVLPTMEVYRVATTMIGLSSGGTPDLFSLECFEKAVAKLAAVDEARESAAARSKASMNHKRDSQGDNVSGTRSADPFAEKHEERLMSGMVNAKDMRTTFQDIHAPQETIESIKMLTTLSLVRPEAFSYGVLATDRIPGCLLYGPPGTGKTLLAKAVAKESGANMIEISGASINNMYVGESEKNVRALFRLAKKKEPMVIFIDEADALLGARGGRPNGGRRETINQFLREWDGMDKMKAFIMPFSGAYPASY
ncbi:hypothetical protein ONZ43_g7797 [Nemania bipapillata]|uniref:Uncharacterized protein n=1 Tax=Nemania bipapillata TaxID=110536 RepID=A0ACC2HP40_9PEZI|nr:hypothetical protein ONZ43_g7797 [Nemania bipapillata]